MTDHLPSNLKRDFRTTRWSLVVSSRRGTDDEAADEGPEAGWRQSLETLCRDYWYPLYSYLRRRGYSTNDAQDLTQDFFAELIHKDFLKVVVPEQGRFRWFLMDAIKKFAAKWNASQGTQKRGGDRKQLSLDFDSGEQRFLNEPSSEWTAEKQFERSCALQLLDRALTKLAAYYKDRGKQRFFDELKIFLMAGGNVPSYAEIAERMSLTPTAVKVAVHRLREKYRQAIQNAVADTLDDPQEIDKEINELLSVL